MSTTHTGKIGRLPWDTRQILGERIEDGIPNKELVQWLNGLQMVKDVLRLRFGGRAITEQNLSEWKQTGHQAWLRREERRALALQLTEQRTELSMEPEEAAGEKEISDRLGRELGMEMARLALALVEQEGSTEERWKRLCEVYREVSQVRRDDHRAARTRIQRERWECEQELQEAAAEEEELARKRQRLMAQIELPIKSMIMAEAFGGGKHGQTMCVRKGKKGNDGSRMTNNKAGRQYEKAEEEASNTNLQHPEKHQEPKPGAKPTEAKSVEIKGVPKTEEIGPNPSKSNQIQPENIQTTKEPRNEGKNDE